MHCLQTLHCRLRQFATAACDLALVGRKASVALFTVMTLLVPSLFAADPAMQVWVNQAYGPSSPNDGHVWGYDAFSSIQDAVNGVGAGGIVNVAAGTFAEQLNIGQDITVTGQGAGTVIQSPAALALSYTYNGTENRAVVFIHDTANGVLQNLTVDGAAQGNANYRFLGVSFYHAGGKALNLAVQGVRRNPFDGVQSGVGLYAENRGEATLRDVEVAGCQITDCQKGGMAFNGNVAVNAHDNRVTGVGSTGQIAQNGIQVGYGASGIVANNEIRGFAYTGADEAAGILVYQAGATISGNLLANNQDAVSVVSPSAAMGPVTLNNFAGSQIGVACSGGGTVNAVSNWWGNVSGPISASNPGGAGVAVGDNVVFSPWLGETMQVWVNLSYGPSSPNDGHVWGYDAFSSIQDAVNGVIAGGIVDVAPGTYNERVVVNKAGLTVRGAGAASVVTGTASAPAAGVTPAVFKVAANGVTISNFMIRVDFAYNHSGVHSSGLCSGLTIASNTIVASGTPAFSYGLRNAIAVNPSITAVGYTQVNGGYSGVSVMGNTIQGTGSTYFRAGIQMDYCGGIISDNTSTAVNHDFISRFASQGDITVTNNTFLGGGAQFGSFDPGAGTVTISGNVFDNSIMQPASGPIGTSASLRLIYYAEVSSANNNVVVSGNTFRNHRWGVSVEDFKNVTFDNNTFTPKAGATDYIHMTFNTKVITSTSADAALNMFPVAATLTRNTFNGSGAAGGTALAFYNHRSSGAVVGTYTIGTPGNENNFNAGIASFVRLDASSGASSSWAGFGEYSGIASTTMAPWTADLDVQNNKFDVGSGLTLPAAMTTADLFEAENRIQHKVDNSVLGLVRLKGANLFVTQSSGSIQRGIDAATAGDTVNVASGSYTENVALNKAVLLVGSGSGTDGTVLATAAGDAATGVVQLSASGSAEVPILVKDLRIAPAGRAGLSVGRFTQSTGTAVDYLTLDNVKVVGSNLNPCTEQERGLYVDLTSSLQHLVVNNCSFDNLHYGLYFQKQVGADASVVRYVQVSDSTFNHNNAKGIYAEKLSEATFTRCTVRDNGYDSSLLAGCSYFVPNMAGVDLNLKAGTYANLSFQQCDFLSNALGAGAVNGVGLAIKGRGTGSDSSYAANPATVAGVSVNNCRIEGNQSGIRFGEPGKANTTPTGVVVENCGFAGNLNGALVSLLGAPAPAVVALNNWWGDVSGPSGAANPYGAGQLASGNVVVAPWLASADQEAGSVGFQPAEGVNYPPTHLAFASQPRGANLGAVLSAQPVVEVRDANGKVTPWANPTVSLAVANNPGNGALGGTASASASAGTASFSGLAITVGGGTGYTLVATAPNLASATSDGFDINNPAPGLASLNPFWKRAGESGFTLTVSGGNFVPNSKVLWNGTEKPTTFVSAGELKVAIAAEDIQAAGTTSVTVENAGPQGGTTAALAFRIEAAAPARGYVDANYAGKAADEVVNFPDDGSAGTHIIGYDAFATIQAGVDAVAAGGTVHVASGSFAENVVLAKPLELAGSGQGSTVVVPAVSNPIGSGGDCDVFGGGTASILLLVQASDVKIHDLTVDGNNPNITSGIVRGGVDIDARAGILTDNRNGTFDRLDVRNVTVRNIYLRGIQNLYGSDINVVSNTVQNVWGSTDCSIGIFNRNGSGLIACNTVSGTPDAISANHSRGTRFLTNTVTLSASGVHTDNNGDAGGLADVIKGNLVLDGMSDSSGSAYGIWVFAPYTTVVVEGNTASNVLYGLSALGQGASVAPIFTGNTVLGTQAAGSVGICVDTSYIGGWGSANVEAVLSSNFVSNHVTGVLLKQQTGYTASLIASNNCVTANGVGIDLSAGQALLQDNNLTANTTAAIRLENGARLDAGDCGSGLTDLGTSTGGNNLSGYGFDNSAPWAIENLNPAASPGVQALHNNFGALAGDSIAAGFQDPNQAVQYSQAPAVLSAPAMVTVSCVSEVPTGATDLAGFVAQGGYFSASAAASVSFNDTAHPTGNGTITRTYTVTDVCGAVALGSQTIVVNDTTPPVLGSLADAMVTTAQSRDPYFTGTPTATDTCGAVTLSYTDDRSGLTGCNGSGFIVRTWTATDAAGNISTSTQKITVTDAGIPEFVNVPANIVVNNTPGTSGAVVSFAQPTARELSFSQGFEEAGWTGGAAATMPSVDWNNYNSAIRQVASGTDGIASRSGTNHAVIDSTSLQAGEDSGAFSRLGGYSTSFGTGYRVAQDVYLNLDDAAVKANTYGWDLSAASSAADGGYGRDFVFHVASDAASQLLVAANNNSGFARPANLADAAHYTVTASGWYTFEWLFRDQAGALAVDCNLRDAVGELLWSQTISAPSDLIATVGGNRYLWFTYLAVDKLAIDNTVLERTVPVTTDPASGSTFPVGTTPVSCTATDACGHTTNTSFTVTVKDTEAPVLGSLADAMVTTAQSRDPYFTGTPTATDTCGAVTLAYSDDRSGLTGCNGSGFIVRTWTATDAAGNVSTSTQKITVTDAGVLEFVNVPANIVLNSAPGKSEAAVTFAQPTARVLSFSQGFEEANWTSAEAANNPSVDWNQYSSAIDRVASGTDGITSRSGAAHAVIDSTRLRAGEDSGVFSRLGGYSAVFGAGYRVAQDVYLNLDDAALKANTYGWDLSAAGNTASGGFSRDFVFHVASDAAGQLLVGANNGSDFAKPNYLASVNHYTVTASGWYTFEWVFRDQAGVLAVDCNLRDAAGALLWSQTLSAPSDLIANMGGNRYLWFTYLAVEKLAIDNTVLERTVPVTTDHASGSAFPVGTTTVNCTATDACGNSTNTSFTVTVTDAGRPTLRMLSCADGKAAVDVRWVSGYPVVIEASADLVNWVPVHTDTAPCTWVDTNAGAVNARFYRAVSAQ